MWTNFSKAKDSRQQLLFRYHDFPKGYMAVTPTILEYPMHVAHSNAPLPRESQPLHHQPTLRLDRSKTKHGLACSANANSLVHRRHPYVPLARANLVP